MNIKKFIIHELNEANVSFDINLKILTLSNFETNAFKTQVKSTQTF